MNDVVRKIRFLSYLSTGAMAFAGVVLLGGYCLRLHTQAKSRQVAEVERVLVEVENQLRDELSVHLQVLDGLRGLYTVFNGQPSADALRIFVESRDPIRALPDVVGSGFVRRVSANDLAAYEEGMRAKAPGYSVSSSELGSSYVAGEHYVIESMESMASMASTASQANANMRHVVGLDLAAEKLRTQTVEQAMLTGKPAMTPQIPLFLGPNRSEPGFLIYLPVYRTGIAPSTIEERRAALVGWVFSSVIAAQTYQSLVASLNTRFRLSVSAPGVDGKLTNWAAGSRQGASSAISSGAATGEIKKTISLVGSEFVLAVGVQPNRDLWFVQNEPIVVFTLGSLLIILSLFGLRANIFSRHFMQAREKQMVSSLFERSDDGMLIFDVKKMCFISCNPATLKMLGIKDVSEVIGRGPLEFSPQALTDGRLSKDEFMRLFTESGETGRRRFDWELRRLDGSVCPLTISVTLVFNEGEKFYLVGWRDISELRATEVELKQVSGALKRSAIV